MLGRARPASSDGPAAHLGDERDRGGRRVDPRRLQLRLQHAVHLLQPAAEVGEQRGGLHGAARRWAARHTSAAITQMVSGLAV
jgi:hypothetical protein